MEDMLLDPSTVSATEKLCFMILDHCRRQEDALENFRKEYTDSKRIEKYNQIMSTVWSFINHEDDNNKYRVVFEYDEQSVMVFETYGTANQLAVSMCLKKLSNDRIKQIWSKLFPSHNIIDLLNYWEEECNINSHHLVWGYDHDASNYHEHDRVMNSKSYSEEDVKKLLTELTLLEIADIVPEIEEVTYKPIQI